MSKRKLLALILAVLMLGNLPMISVSAEAEAQSVSVENVASSFDSSSSYYSYFEKYSTVVAPNRFTEIAGDSITLSENSGKAISFIEGRSAAVLSNENAWCEWEFDIPVDGRYAIYLDYFALEASGKEILLSLEIDGEKPYSEAANFRLPRLWKDVVNDDRFEKDNIGDDIQPVQEESKVWLRDTFIDVEGLYSEPYFVYLEEGNHTIKLTIAREAVAISEICFGNEERPVTYAEYFSKFDNIDKNSGTKSIVQAELIHDKNTSLIYPTYDRSDASTTPNSPSTLCLNTIGQANWNTVGDSISWKVDIEKAGFYRIAMRARQNQNQGMKSYRTLEVNGKIPFAEAENIAFPYAQKWYIKTLGDDNPYYLYLEPGDIITLTAVSGEMSESLRDIRQSLLMVNALYREIITVTSTEPDIYRDYSLASQIPDIEKRLLNMADFMKSTADKISVITGTRGSQAAELDYVAEMLYEFSEDAETIPERLTNFKDAINDIGAMISNIGSQPLELDYIAFLSESAETPRVSVGFFERLSFGIRQFLSSFVLDYNVYGTDKNSDDVTINVWVSTGRDEMRIIKNLISDSFTPKHNINVNLNMVDTGSTLIKASLSGKGPDAALLVSGSMELAYRGALVELSQYGIDDIYGEFYSDTWTPYKYNGGIYALPETESFDLLFYRTDVFSELGLTVPNTWDDFYDVMETLQKEQLLVGIPEINAANMGVSSGINTFYKFLLQSGEYYFDDTQMKVNFNSEKGYDAFYKWVELYREYGLPRQYDFYSRFRTGEMPLAIQNYTSYNQLSKAAPELKGLWSFAPIPGTECEDGTISRAQNATFSGCVMMQAAVKKGNDKETAEFLKWWVSEDTQTAYALKLEGTMGIAARYTPANRNTLKNLSWSISEHEILDIQMSEIRPIPAVPGNYLINRSLTTAFRAAVSGTSSTRQALTVSVKSINDEIARKRKEFNLE